VSEPDLKRLIAAIGVVGISVPVAAGCLWLQLERIIQLLKRGVDPSAPTESKHVNPPTKKEV